MTTANKPENQKPNGPRDLGQIAKEQSEAERFHDLATSTARETFKPERPKKPYVVVEFQGTEYQHEIRDFETLKAASKWMEWKYFDQIEELGVDIMKRTQDGTLTTEY